MARRHRLTLALSNQKRLCNMKRHLTSLLAFVACLALPMPAIAVDLRNEDSVRYAVIVEESTSKQTHILRPGEALPDICYRCDITVEGVGSISAQPGDTIVIRNRSFQVVS